MEPKIYSALFLAGLFFASTFVVGFIDSIALSSLAAGIIFGLAIFAFGGYYIYLFFTKSSEKEDQIFNGFVGFFCIVSGIITCFIPKYSFNEYNGFSRFFITLFSAGGLYLIACIYWYIPIQKLANGTIPTLGFSDLKQTIYFIVCGFVNTFILSIAFCIGFSSSSVFGKLVLRTFVSSIFAAVIGALYSYYLHTKSSQTGYEPTVDTKEQIDAPVAADPEAAFE